MDKHQLQSSSLIQAVNEVVATPLQQGMIFHHLGHPDSGIDIEQITLFCSAPLDPVKLNQALARLLDHHEVLRCCCDWQSGDQPLLRAGEPGKVNIGIQVLDPEESLEAALVKHQQEERIRGFELDQSPLMRATLLQADSGSALCWTFHHILLDGRSFAPLVEELMLGYSNGTTPAPDPVERPRFAQYARWLQDRDHSESLVYWREYLADLPGATLFPTLSTEHTSTKNVLEPYGFRERSFAADTTALLTTACQVQSTSVNALLQAAWGTLLHHYTGEAEVVFGATYTTRHCEFPGAADILGLMINTLPVRIDFAALLTTGDLLRQLSAHAREIRPHILAPLNLVAQQTDFAGVLFDTAVIFDRIDLHHELREKQPGWDHLHFKYEGRTNFPVALIAYGGQELSLRLEYDRRRLDDAHAEVILDCLQNLMERFASGPELFARHVPLLTETNRSTALTPVIAAANPTINSLVERFKQSSTRFAENVALRCGAAVKTYREVDAESDKVARTLVAAGVQPEDRVALCMDRSNDLIVGLMGILKAGAAYVPIDPNYPDTRIRFTLDDAGIDYIVTDADTTERLSPFERTLLEVATSAANTNDADVILPTTIADQLAYVIYTSGSTGQPKGVAVTHKNVARLMDSTQHWFGFNETDKWTLFHSIAFDWTVFELWGAFAYGGELTVVPYWVTRSPLEFNRLLSANGITVLCQTPSAFSNLQEVDEESHAECPKKLRYVIFGGEALDIPSLAPWISRYGDSAPQLINMYGITETTVHVTYRRICQSDIETSAGSVIGEPIPDLDILLLNEQLEPLPAGVVGEMYVAGAGVARGYLNREELTRERFIDNFSGTGHRVYRTGDLARWLPNGDLIYSGRADSQVKIRGFRIELGEIEGAIATVTGVQRAVVIASKGPGGHPRLVGYYTAHAVKPEDVTRVIESVLPAHMVPATLICLPELPLTVNGKVDIRQLPDPQFVDPTLDYRAPENALQQTLVTVWEAVLGTTGIGIADNFFERGGDSILCIKLISRARKENINLGVREIYNNPTIESMALLAMNSGHTGLSGELVFTTELIPLLPVQQWFFDSVGHFHHWNQCYCFKIRAPITLEVLTTALGRLSLRHPILRAAFDQVDGRWQQRIHPEQHFNIAQYQVEDDNQRAALLATINQKVEFSGEKNVSVGLFNHKRGVQELCLAIHHLVVDGISWSVLINELDDLLQTTAEHQQSDQSEQVFRQWSHFIADNAQLFTHEAGYWQERALIGIPAPGSFHHSARFEASIDLAAVNWPARSDIAAHELVVAAFFAALPEVLPHHAPRVDMESHGRSHEVSGLDFSQGTGWYTTIYPLALTAAVPTNLLDLLSVIHQEIIAIPGNGVGFGVLNQKGLIERQARADFLFNFMGNFSRLFNDCQLLEIMPPDYQDWRDPGAAHSHPAEWLVAIDQSKLFIDVFFDDKYFAPSVIEHLSATFVARLAELNSILIPQRVSEDKLLVSPSRWDEVAATEPSCLRILNMTPIQELYLFGQLGGHDTGIEQWYLRYQGKINSSALHQAWEETLNNHSGLCTTFPLASGRNLQTFHASARFTWRTVETSANESLEDLLQQESSTGLNVNAGPMHRLMLVTTGAMTHYLVWTHHHLQIDGWSWPIVLAEVSSRYRTICGQTAPADLPASDYAEYANWIPTTRPKNDVNFWQTYLANLGSAGRLPTMHTGIPGILSHHISLDESLSNLLVRGVTSMNCTLSSLFHAAWAVTLTKLTRQKDVCIGSTFSGRPAGEPDFTRTVGPFVTNLPLRVTQMAIAPAVQDVQDQMLTLQEKQYHSSAEIHQASGLAWIDPMFESVVVFQNYEINEATYDMGPDLGVDEVSTPIRTNFPFTLVVNPGVPTTLELIYNTDRLSAGFVEDAATSMIKILHEFTGGSLVDMSEAGDYSDFISAGGDVFCKGEAPQNAQESSLVSIWTELFGLPGIGVTDNFFDLGGRSIMVPVLIRRIEAETGVTLPVAALYRDPTIQGLAAWLNRSADTGAPGSRNLSEIQSRSERAKAARQKAKQRRNK